MSKASHVKADQISLSGSVVPFQLHSGRLTNAAAAQYGNMNVSPVDLYVARVVYYIDTQFTHASSKFNLGTVASVGAYILGVALQNVATGYYELDMSAATTVTRIIPAGVMYGFGLDSADTTGKIAITGILTPYSHLV